jgi:Mg2+ and Co2+ transporter CorA
MTEEKLKFIYGDIKRHINEMHSSAETNRRELSKIYSYVRDLILEREQTLKR